jgi:hypothetical protein
VAVEIVTKAELSRLLGLSRARVTQYANMGMPVLSDGKLDLAACLDWLSQNVYLWNNRWLDRGVFRLVQGPGIPRRGSRATSMARPRTRNGGPRSGAPAGGARDPATSAEYLHQKVRQIRAAADKLQISNARRRGELVPADEVQRRHEEILLMLRDSSPQASQTASVTLRGSPAPTAATMRRMRSTVARPAGARSGGGGGGGGAMGR